MKQLLFSALLFFIFINLSAQTNISNAVITKNDSAIFTYAEVMPQFPNNGFQNYLRNNIKYPFYEKDLGVQGSVYIKFIVEKDGSVTNVQPIKEVPCGPGFTREGMRVISQMPNWTPGMKNGQPVRVEIMQPIRFVLDNDNTPGECGIMLTSTEQNAACNCNPGTLPEFPGGDSALNNYFSTHLILSKDTREKWSKNPVSFNFVIDTFGRICDVHVVLYGNEDGLQGSLDNAICGMPLWKPGSGEPNKINVRMSGKIFIGENTGAVVRMDSKQLIPFHNEKHDYTPASHASNYKTPFPDKIKSDSVQVRHILIAYNGSANASPEIKRSKAEAKMLADSLCRVIQSGQTKMEDLVLEFTDDPGSKSGNLGNYGWFTRDSGFVKEFKDAGFNNAVGTTLVVETAFGYHVIQVLKKSP